MSIKDLKQYKTTTITTGEVLPIITSSTVNINKTYSGISDIAYRKALNLGQLFASRILSYNGYSPSTYIPMGNISTVSSSRIWKKAKRNTSTSGLKFQLELSFEKITDDTNFTVVPNKTTMFEFSISTTSTIDDINEALIISYVPYIWGMFENIYGMAQSEYTSLYGKVQLADIIVNIEF